MFTTARAAGEAMAQEMLRHLKAHARIEINTANREEDGFSISLTAYWDDESQLTIECGLAIDGAYSFTIVEEIRANFAHTPNTTFRGFIIPDLVMIDLVGQCNGNRFFTEHLGTIITDERGGQMLPFLVHGERNRCNPYQLQFTRKELDYYDFQIPDWYRGHGLAIKLDEGVVEYTFLTGLNARESGSSGPLAYGGTEIVRVLNRIFFGL